MHISLTIGAILLSFVHQFYCENKLESHFKGSDSIVPSAPYNLTIKKRTSTEIHLTWAKPLDVINRQPVQLQSLHRHGVSKETLLKSNDVLANKDTTLVGLLKDATSKRVHPGGESDPRVDNSATIDETHKFQSNLASPDETWESVEDKPYRRRKRRRDLTGTPSDTLTTLKETVSNEEVTEVLKDEAREQSTKKTSDMIDEGSHEDIDSEEHHNPNINYLLFYEEGPPGGPMKSTSKDEESSERNRIKNILLEHHNGKDGIKGVKFVLRELKPYTHYRIWVRAFFAQPSSELFIPPPEALGPASEVVMTLTDVPPPSPPIIKSLACHQPPGTISLEWSRPLWWSGGLDAYVVALKRNGTGGFKQRIQLDTHADHIDTFISLPVDIYNNVSYYEVTLQAATRSIVDPDRLINGSITDPYPVIMTPDCKPVQFTGISKGSNVAAQDSEQYVGIILGPVVLLIAGTATLITLLVLYRWGCTSVFKRCFPMSSLLLREGAASDGSEGCGEGGTPGKTDHGGYSKKIVSPAHTVVFWGGGDGSGGAGGSPVGRELLWDEAHPPVASDNFLAHTAALHADGDIGFGKEYDLIQSKSAMLGYTSNHSQHPDNRHKNRYLNITAYDHSRVCLLPSSCCSCEAGKEHRKSCASSRPSSGQQPAEPVSQHGDYVNANFIDGIAAELTPDLSRFIIAQNERRKAADRKKLQINTVDSGIVQDSSDEDAKKRGTALDDFDKTRPSAAIPGGRGFIDSSIESKIPLGFETVDPMVSMAVFDTKMPIIASTNKDKLSLDLGIDRKPVDVSNDTCRLSINLDRKDEKHDDVKSEKSVKIGKKRSTSADTRDIVVDKKSSSRGHSKNSSVVVNISQDSPLGGAPKIEGAFLNIEFSGIVDSERELQKAREAERLEEANRLAKEAAEESMDDLDDLYVQIDGSAQRVKSSWLLDRRRYIGTQGPTPGTLPAFWRMVWDHHVAVIVMITNLVERGRRKCDMYWPKEGTETYGAIQVTTLNEDVMATYTVRMFQIKNTKSNTRRSVVQYHYTVWPDHGTPEHPLAVLRFREAARRAAPPQAGAVLVHCSAGVGRTGTYIVLDAMLNHLRLTGSLNVFGFLCHVRSQRNFLVQTEEQYVFIHDALLEAIQSGDTEVPAEKAKEYLKKLLEPFPEGHRPDGSGAPDRKIGLYGAPLIDSEDTVAQDLLRDGVRIPRPDDDFGLWNTDGSGERFGDDRTLDECRNELVSASLRSGNNPNSECNGDISDSKDSGENSVAGKNGGEREALAHRDSDDDQKNSESKIGDKMIDFGDILVDKNKDLNETSMIITSGDKNDDSMSTNSLNAVKSDRSAGYEKLNGTRDKTGDGSKATSVSDEEADLLPDGVRLDVQDKSGEDAENGNRSGGGDTDTVTSSISSDTNRLNNLSSLRDRPGFSPVIGSQDGVEIFRKERNARGKGEDNYETLGGSSRIGGGPDSCFAGGHRFACQRRDSGGKKARNLLEHQFNLVCAFEPSKFHTVSADKQVNSVKNRKGAVLPVESGRVHLIPKPGEEGSDYINATWLQGHRSLREYVVTQHPLSNTVDDLYRLLWDHSCQLLVVLTDCDEDPECDTFWPTEENQEINAYNYCIRFTSQEKHLAKRKPPSDDVPLTKGDERTPSLLIAGNRTSSPLQSPSSGNCNRSFALKPAKGVKGTSGSPDIDVESDKHSPVESLTSKSDDSVKQNAGFYRRQSSADNQDEERLIPKSDEPPSLEGPEELKKLNCDEIKSDGYTFDRSELLRIDTSNIDNSTSPKVSPNKRLMLNGDICLGDDSSSKKQCKSPSKISLKSLRLHSPVLKSPTKFKFDFGNRTGNKSDERSSPKAIFCETIQGFQPKFEMVEYKDSSQLRDGVEEIGRDCIITTTHMTMNSIQDDYELKVCLIQCPKWLADLDYDENSDTDEGSDEDEFEMEAKALDFVMERRLKAYRGVFGLPEYLVKCQDDYKNSPVVVIDKYGGARAASLCTLSGAIRRRTRDVYSLAKLHHGRRAGAWRRPSDLRALYEAMAAYQD